MEYRYSDNFIVLHLNFQLSSGNFVFILPVYQTIVLFNLMLLLSPYRILIIFQYTWQLNLVIFGVEGKSFTSPWMLTTDEIWLFLACSNYCYFPNYHNSMCTPSWEMCVRDLYLPLWFLAFFILSSSLSLLQCTDITPLFLLQSLFSRATPWVQTQHYNECPQQYACWFPWQSTYQI